MLHGTLQGKIGLSDGNRGTSAKLNWQQSYKHFNINLSGPLQLGSLNIQGLPDVLVTLHTSTGTHLQAKHLKDLLAEHLPWEVPIKDLAYWLKGIPVPHSKPKQLEFDSLQQIRHLEQNAWNINYLRYTPTQYGVSFPEKILLSQANIKVKIIIKQWKFCNYKTIVDTTRSPRHNAGYWGVAKW